MDDPVFLDLSGAVQARGEVGAHHDCINRTLRLRWLVFPFIYNRIFVREKLEGLYASADNLAKQKLPQLNLYREGPRCFILSQWSKMQRMESETQ